MLDPLAARMTAAVASDTELHAIGATLHAEPGAVSDERLFEHNRAFHRAVYVGCGNSELVAVLDHLWDRTERYRYILVTTRIDKSASGHDHQEIADALRRRDLRHVSRLLAAHVKRSHDLTRSTQRQSAQRQRRTTVVKMATAPTATGKDLQAANAEPSRLGPLHGPEDEKGLGALRRLVALTTYGRGLPRLTSLAPSPNS